MEAAEIQKLITEKTKECETELTAGIDATAASQRLVQLSSLLASLNAKITDTHFLLNQKKVELLKESKSVAQMRVFAEASPEWKALVDLMNTKEALMELIRAVKYYLKSAMEEYHEGTNT